MRPHWQALLIFCVSLAIYRSSDRYFQTGDNAPAERLPILILEEGTLDFTGETAFDDVPRPYWLASRKGRLISFYPIVPGLLNVPVFALAKWRGLDLEAHRFELSKWTACILSAASVAAIWLALTEVCAGAGIALLATALYAFGTAAWSVGTQALWQHGPSLFFLSAALALLLRPQSRWTVFSGFFLGLAVFNRPANLVFAVPLAAQVLIAQFRAPRRLAAFFLLAAIPAAAMTAYSIMYWDSFWALGQGHRFAGRHGVHQTGFSFPLWSGLAGLLFSPGRGLFVYSPVLLPAFPLLFAQIAGGRPVLRFLCLGAVADLLLFARWNVWWGGHCFGYRMLTELLPALALCLGVFLSWVAHSSRLSKLTWMALLAPLAAGSVYANFLGAFYYPSSWNDEKHVDEDPDRLWDLHDTELARLQQTFFSRLPPRLPKSLPAVMP